MPIYEYQCERCQHRLEALQKISDAPLQECPACHEPALKKLVSAASFRLKGGGWYETDFKKDKRKQLADSDSDSGKNDAKPEAGTDKSSAGSDAKKAANGNSGAKKPPTGKAAGNSKSPSASKSDK